MDKHSSRKEVQDKLLKWEEIRGLSSRYFKRTGWSTNKTTPAASWQQDNEYVLSGYRPVSNSYWLSVQSLMQIHNETINIYSHLLGALLFFGLPYPIYLLLCHRFQTFSLADVIVFSTFFYGVGVCFIFSATFHLFNNHSESVCIFGNQLDYLGIVILMWGATVPTVYYGYYCDPFLQKTYYTMCTALAIACVITTLQPGFRHPSWRSFRSAMYAGFGLSAIIPIIHGMILYGWSVQKMRMSLDWMGLMAILNLLGAAIYGIRIPEKWYPYKHDTYGNSHQILHFMVVFAGIAHLFGLLRAFGFVHALSDCG